MVAGIKYSVKAYGITDIGLQRQNNEDSYAIDEQRGIYIVADGLGGHEAGEIASKLATEAILDFFKKQGGYEPDEAIEKAVSQADKFINDFAQKKPALGGMGTTVVLAVWQEPDIFYLANVGDSRAYLFRNGKLELLSTDDSLVSQLVKEGQIRQQDVRTHYLRNVVTRALGLKGEEGCHKKKVTVLDNDVFLLCSDGLWDLVNEEIIELVLSKEHCSMDACSRLIQEAKSRGGQDNITAIAICVTKYK